MTTTSDANWAFTLTEHIRDSLDEIEAIGSRGGQIPGAPTGIADLDALIGGLRAGLVHTIFGPTGIGSSTLALNFARSAALGNDHTALFLSGQTPYNELLMRLLAAEARVPGHYIRSGTMRDDDWTKLARRMADLTAKPLYVRSNPSLTWDEIQDQCRQLKQQRDLRLLVIDGAHLFARPTAPETLWAAQTRLSADIKRLAVDLGIAVVLTAPTNRRADYRYDRRPTLSDIASSSAYAADADVVIGVHREDAYEPESPRAGEADLVVLKNRYGAVATITVAFQGHYCRFVDMAPADPPPARLRPVPGSERSGHGDV